MGRGTADGRLDPDPFVIYCPNLGWVLANLAGSRMVQDGYMMSMVQLFLIGTHKDIHPLTCRAMQCFGVNRCYNLLGFDDDGHRS